MPRQNRVNRRRFLGESAAAASGLFIASRTGRGGDTVDDLATYPSNEHFWYRPQPPGLFVDSQCDNRAFAYADGKVLLSEDNGRTWPHAPLSRMPATSFSAASCGTATSSSVHWRSCT